MEFSSPAAGNCNNTNFNNGGSNGNYWSSSLNTSNTNNAYNLNFNSSNVNPSDNNNRYNGFTVRPVSAFTHKNSIILNMTNGKCIMPPAADADGYHLTRDQLMRDLYQAYLDAREHKRGKPYQMKFEMHLEDNLTELCDELWNRTYNPLPSKCFIIEDPTLREVFAADFRDRVVHHLYYNYTYKMFDQTFIDDSYSCRKNKGTLYGVERQERHIYAESDGYQKKCYVLKMDISGYFMHISRDRLLKLCLSTLHKVSHRKSNIPHKRWMDIVDMDFVEYLTREIVLLDPTEDCRIYGRKIGNGCRIQKVSFVRMMVADFL